MDITVGTSIKIALLQVAAVVIGTLMVALGVELHEELFYYRAEDWAVFLSQFGWLLFAVPPCWLCLQLFFVRRQMSWLAVANAILGLVLAGSFMWFALRVGIRPLVVPIGPLASLVRNTTDEAGSENIQLYMTLVANPAGMGT